MDVCIAIGKMSKKAETSKRRRKQVQPARRISSWASPIILTVLVIGTFLIRTLPSWNKVFVGGEVWFRGVDSWYHMRLVDNMMVNFPLPLKWDMSILFPSGMSVGYFPLLSWIVALPGQILDYEVVGALLPPILGALILIPVYFICKTLWRDWVGLIACMLVMLLPSELFHRTLLGFTDHHMLEVLFLATTVLFLILLAKEEKPRWVVLGGVSLGLYMSSWAGGLLLVALVWLWSLISIFSKLRRGEPIDTFCKNISIVFGLSLIVFLPNLFFIQGLQLHILTLGLITLSPMVLLELSRRIEWIRVLGATLVILGLAGTTVQLVSPQFLDTAKSVFVSPATTIQEATASDPGVLMAHFGISLFLCIGGLIFAIRKKQNLLLVVWSIFMLILTISQRRWSYYFILNDAILAGYFIYLLQGWFHRSTRKAIVTVICVMLLATNLPGTIGMSNLSTTITEGWYQSCVWLRENTPGMEGYYALDAEKPTYGILSWWDYGNWITRIGHRAPCSNPMAQTPGVQWKAFLAGSEEEANGYLEEIDYIIVDYSMVTTKFYAIGKLAPKDTPINEDIFILRLWNESSTTWKKICQIEEVKIFARV